VRGISIPREKSLRTVATESLCAPLLFTRSFPLYQYSLLRRPSFSLVRASLVLIWRPSLWFGIRTSENSPQYLTTQVIRGVFISPPIPTHSASSREVSLATNLITMSREILVSNLTEVYPFIMIWVKYFVFLLRFIRWI